jgi:hypothetical protein
LSDEQKRRAASNDLLALALRQRDAAREEVAKLRLELARSKRAERLQLNQTKDLRRQLWDAWTIAAGGLTQRQRAAVA